MDMIVAEIHDALRESLDRGDEQGAMTYLKENFARLPEEVQGEILTRGYLAAMQEEIEQSETILELQKKTISAIQALEVLKEELEKEQE